MILTDGTDTSVMTKDQKVEWVLWYLVEQFDDVNWANPVISEDLDEEEVAIIKTCKELLGA